MSAKTKIQWCDSSVNPIMGCTGCELFPKPGEVLASIDKAVAATGVEITSKPVFKQLVDEAFEKIKKPQPGHKKIVNTTNIWHLRHLFADRLLRDQGAAASKAATKAIGKALTCYAATLHLNKGANILKPDYETKKGYAPIFEMITPYEGRMEEAAKWPDLLGQINPATPWKERLPRMIFVSDMGDALSATRYFPFLNAEALPAFQSKNGKRHLWLWLTKQPANMAKIVESAGGFPPNVCAMTTVTNSETLWRADELRRVKATIRGLSIEPQWERITPSKLDLRSIDWVILGGESGPTDLARPFEVEWAEELREHCQKQGVAFFLKQLGRNPSRNGKVFRLKDEHGGDWDEWEEHLRVREFPKAFHTYRAEDMSPTNQLRPIVIKKTPMVKGIVVTAEEKTEFTKLNKVVKRGVEAFADAGEALVRIHEGKLWRAGGHNTWEDYCRSAAGISKVHASRLMRASQCLAELKTLPIGNVLPLAESQVRPLLKLVEPEMWKTAWAKAVEGAEGRQPTALEVNEAVFEVLPPQDPEGKPETVKEHRQRLLGSLKNAIHSRAGWEKLEEIVAEFEELA